MIGDQRDFSAAELVSPTAAAASGAALIRASWPARFAGVVLVLAIEVLPAVLVAGYFAWPLIICGVLKIVYDFALLWSFRRTKAPEES